MYVSARKITAWDIYDSSPAFIRQAQPCLVGEQKHKNNTQRIRSHAEAALAGSGCGNVYSGAFTAAPGKQGRHAITQLPVTYTKYRGCYLLLLSLSATKTIALTATSVPIVPYCCRISISLCPWKAWYPSRTCAHPTDATR